MKVAYGQKWYRPRDIARLGLIKNSTGGDREDSNYAFILSLISTGRLRAKNHSKGKTGRPFWLVPEKEIARYHDTVTKVKL